MLFVWQKVDEMYREAPIDKNGMFDYLEFTRILKHGAKDKDDQWMWFHSLDDKCLKLYKNLCFMCSFAHIFHTFYAIMTYILLISANNSFSILFAIYSLFIYLRIESIIISKSSLIEWIVIMSNKIWVLINNNWILLSNVWAFPSTQVIARIIVRVVWKFCLNTCFVL